MNAFNVKEYLSVTVCILVTNSSKNFYVEHKTIPKNGRTQNMK